MTTAHELNMIDRWEAEDRGWTSWGQLTWRLRTNSRPSGYIRGNARALIAKIEVEGLTAKERAELTHWWGNELDKICELAIIMIREKHRPKGGTPLDENGQTDIFDHLDQDQPGELCRHSAELVTDEEKWQTDTVCRCGRRVTIRTDQRLPRHRVPVR